MIDVTSQNENDRRLRDLIDSLKNHLVQSGHRVRAQSPFEAVGKLSRLNGLVMEATGIRLPLGASCEIQTLSGRRISAEVVGFEDDTVFMMPSEDMNGIGPGDSVFPAYSKPLRLKLGDQAESAAEDMTKRLPVSNALLGRVVDAAGKPLDGLGALGEGALRSLHAVPINPLERAPIREPLDVGIRAINALLTVGRGQRIGLFAGSGVGKSVLLGMMARSTAAEVIVVGLIGERGREVKEFIEETLGEEGRKRSVVVAAPADVSPLMRLQGAAYATTIAEYFRDQGLQVLLIMDSLTRYAMAQREIALAVGEPPATRGYPPSVFAKLPALVERAGAGAARDGKAGSITAFYTVLAEGDDQQDPIADASRAILDGHIVLSRTLAEQGHYPAIDIEQSISRVMHSVVSQEQMEHARKLKNLFSTYQRSRDLIAVGAYKKGADPVIDQSVSMYPSISEFLQQRIHEKESFERARAHLSMLMNLARKN